MNKTVKRLTKLTGNPNNAVVIGTGFGMLSDILATYKTVFLFADHPPNFKVRNLVYRENFDDIAPLSDITAIIVDRDKVYNVSHLRPLWSRARPVIFVEGDEIINRTESRILWEGGYRPVEQVGFCHVWKL
jgi:hypothetical protein